MEAQDEERQRFLKNKLFANHQQKIMVLSFGLVFNA
jgi:hypothetical protein